ncbi:DUF6125 family protein [Coprobacter sp.]
MDQLEQLSKKELIELVRIFAKNMLALDGVWFQSIEAKHGMDEAIEHDRNAWRKYTVTEARRIKTFLNLPEKAGIEGLKIALDFHFNAFLNKTEVAIDADTLVYRVVDCRVQTARRGKGMPLHPCKSVGIIEYTYFAKEIDCRFDCETISCFPDITDPDCACCWKFTLRKE